jgi:hypothetical protein
MAVTVPSWFKGRQGKADEVGPGLLKLTAPNLKEWIIGIRRHADGRWTAFLRDTPEGTDTVAVELDAVPEYDAWEAAFEVYRNRVIV